MQLHLGPRPRTHTTFTARMALTGRQRSAGYISRAPLLHLGTPNSMIFLHHDHHGEWGKSSMILWKESWLRLVTGGRRRQEDALQELEKRIQAWGGRWWTIAFPVLFDFICQFVCSLQMLSLVIKESRSLFICITTPLVTRFGGGTSKCNSTILFCFPPPPF